jgi:hypothetical protein
VLPLLDAALGLVAAVEPDAPGWLLPDDAHPATAAAQTSAAAARAGRPVLSRMARGEYGNDHGAFHDASIRNKSSEAGDDAGWHQVALRESLFRWPGREPGPFGMKIVI